MADGELVGPERPEIRLEETLAALLVPPINKRSGESGYVAASAGRLVQSLRQPSAAFSLPAGHVSSVYPPQLCVKLLSSRSLTEAWHHGPPWHA